MGELFIDSDRLGVGSNTSRRIPSAEPNAVDLLIGAAMANVTELIIRVITAETNPQPTVHASTTVFRDAGTA